MDTFEPATFADLQKWVNGIENQADGRKAVSAQTGEHYRVFGVKIPCRPSDVGVAEEFAVRAMRVQLEDYFANTCGTIYWRIPLEIDYQPFATYHYTPHGTDHDPVTDKKAIADKNWLSVGIYCRLLRSNAPQMTEDQLAA